MTVVAQQTGITRIKITMREIHDPSLEDVRGQLDAVAVLLNFAQFAEALRGDVFGLGYYSGIDEFSADSLIDVERLTLNTPLILILSAVPMATATTLFTIINKWNEVRENYARTNRIVTRQRMQEHAANLVLTNLAEIAGRGTVAAARQPEVISDAVMKASRAVMQVVSLQLDPEP